MPQILFLDLNLSLSNETISIKIDDKQDAFDFVTVIFPFFLFFLFFFVFFFFLWAEWGGVRMALSFVQHPTFSCISNYSLHSEHSVLILRELVY